MMEKDIFLFWMIYHCSCEFNLLKSVAVFLIKEIMHYKEVAFLLLFAQVQ